MKKALVSLIILILLTITVSGSLAGSEVQKSYVWYDNAGEYTGEIDTNNIPFGYGLFECKDPAGNILWRYIGYWKDGLPNGTGTIYYREGPYETGIYENGILVKGTRYTFAGASVEEIKPTSTATDSEVCYIGNKKSLRFHELDCHSVETMKESNKVELHSREEAIERGFIPCGDCHP